MTEKTQPQEQPLLLLVDDDPTFTRVMARALTRRGLEVETAGDAEEAMQLARQRKPDYAVLDLKMEGDSGLVLLPRLLELYPDLRVVILTGYSSITTAVEAINAVPATICANPPMRTTCSRHCCRTRPIRKVWCPSTPCRWTACSGSISSGCWPSTTATSPLRPGHWACTAGPFSANCRSAPCVAEQTFSCDKRNPGLSRGLSCVRSMRISVLTDTADDPGLVVPIGTFQPPALIEVLALVGGELAVHAAEANGGHGPAFALLDAFQAYFQLIDEAVAAGRIGTAFGQHLLQQGRVQVFGHARHIVVTPVALQGVEVLLRAFQEAVGIKPGGCVHGDRGCCRLGGGALARPDRLLLRGWHRTTRRVRLALH